MWCGANRFLHAEVTRHDDVIHWIYGWKRGYNVKKLGWVVQIYNAAGALPNLLNPFWMLPLLGMLHMKARDLVGYSMLQLIFHIPQVFFLCWLFAKYIPYVAPVLG